MKLIGVVVASSILTSVLCFIAMSMILREVDPMILRGHDAFSLATFGLYLVTVLIGITTVLMTVVGPRQLERQLEKKIENRITEERVDEKIEESVKKLTTEDRGRFYIGIGYVFGQLYVTTKEERYIDRAITMTSRAFSALPNKSYFQHIAENNWAYYASLKGDVRDASKALDLAFQFRDRFHESKDIEEILTYVSVILAYSEWIDDKKDQLKYARGINQSILSDQRITVDQKDRAEAYEKLLSERLG